METCVTFINYGNYQPAYQCVSPWLLILLKHILLMQGRTFRCWPGMFTFHLFSAFQTSGPWVGKDMYLAAFKDECCFHVVSLSNTVTLCDSDATNDISYEV